MAENKEEIKDKDTRQEAQAGTEQKNSGEQEAKAAENKAEKEKTEETGEKGSDKAEKEQTKDSEKAQAKEEKDPLEEAQKQIAELKDKYLRSVAEFDNYKKRTLKEKAELILNGGERTITAVLPVLDDMERALADKSDDAEAVRKGMQMIYKKFVKTLEGIGVKKIETENQDFNTDLHEAVAMVPGMSDDKKGKVIDCLQAGYTLNDKVIRHAKVAVAQ
ncbi:MAG: nucleotide exchange factor GrpE [Prevotella sp.]|jgi:molecular chaperone GrpE